MKWIDFINSKLNKKTIKKLMIENKSIKILLNNFSKYEDNIKREIEYVYKNPYKIKGDYRIISILDDEYPNILKNIHNFPIFLYLQGKKLNLDKTVSVVGTRNSTLLGEKTCEKILEELNEYDGINIVTGLERGIEKVCIKKAYELKMNLVAISPVDILSCYPKINLKLKELIKEIGTVISPFNIGDKVLKENFLKRNELIAAFSRAVYIAQTYNSGISKITARYAYEYGREIYCSPGSVFDKSFEGCNNLIMKNYAKLINSGDDIAYEYGWRKKNEKIFSNS